jgi:hypothetical protein
MKFRLDNGYFLILTKQSATLLVCYTMFVTLISDLGRGQRGGSIGFSISILVAKAAS